MPDTVLVASRSDPASSNIADALIHEHGFERTSDAFEGTPIYVSKKAVLIFTQRELLFADHLDERFAPDAYIFLSKHRSESRIPTLTVHTTGNFTEDAPFGGRPLELGLSYPSLQKSLVRELVLAAGSLPEYDAVVETTHHGPTSLRSPILFAEIGPTEKEWRDEEAARVVAHALSRALSRNRFHGRVAIGLGGPHYSRKFTRVLAESEYAVATIAPKHVLPFVTQRVLAQMTLRSVEKVTYALLEWKGLGGEKERVLQLLPSTGLKVVQV